MSKKKIINEIGDTPEGQFMLGRLQGRQNQRARGEQTTGRIKQTTRRADDYWRGTDFNDGENFEDSQSWADSYDDYDQYGDFDSDAYERNQQERERDQERQSELYSRVQNKLNSKIKNESKNIMKKNTIRLTESDLKKIISESVKKVLKEDTERVINVEYDENTSFSKGRKYYYCHDNGRYYTNIDGEWYICTDNYYLEPDVHVDPNVKIISESVKKVVNEGFYPDEIYGVGASWDGFADEEPPIVPIRFGEQNRPKFKKMTDEAYHLLQELRYNVATKEQKDEIVQAMKLVRHACMGR